MAVIYINVFLSEKSILPVCVRNILVRATCGDLLQATQLKRVSKSIAGIFMSTQLCRYIYNCLPLGILFIQITTTCCFYIHQPDPLIGLFSIPPHTSEL